MKRILEEIEAEVAPEAREKIDWTHSQEKSKVVAEENCGHPVVCARDRHNNDDRGLEDGAESFDR